MSVLYQNQDIFIIDHQEIINKIIYSDDFNYCVNATFFNILQAFNSKKRRKKISEEATYISNRYNASKGNILSVVKNDELDKTSAKKTAERFYDESPRLFKCVGGNTENKPIVVTLNERQYIIPANCKFYCQDIADIGNYICEQFDFILMDPPWWNKYVKRKRKWNEDHGYEMMWNKDLQNLPIDKILSDEGLVAIWCTNAQQHLRAIKEELFPLWGVEYVGQWFWLKITKKGELVTPFSPENGKQPYERIIFGAKPDKVGKNPEPGKIVVSVPSAVHSHKPPLMDLLKSYLPENAKCLELFARYLLPGWTSYGNEVLKLQDINFFTERK